jgi:hypothetical protein
VRIDDTIVKADSIDIPRRITAAQVLQTVARSQPLDAEWIGVKDTDRIFGLSRPRVFKLIALGQLDSVHLRDVGKSKGIRLISVSSIRAYIESFREGAAA